MAEPTFYRAWHAPDKLEPGARLALERKVEFDSWRADQSGLPALAALSQEELQSLKAASVQKEQALFSEIEALSAKWTKQAEETLAARKAQEYLRSKPVPHTSNRWVDGEYDWHERSNMVYKFTWRVYENMRWSRTAQKSVPVAWELTWYLVCNTPHNADDTSTGRQLAGQTQKRFTDKAALEKYLQGRIAAYDHLFREISPPIPAEHRRRFCVNGVLLPGYTAEVPVEKAADSLMEFLEDGDILPERPRHPAQKKPKRSVPTR